MAAKILIIEDESVIRRELKILLENAMYEVAVLTEFHHILQQRYGDVFRIRFVEILHEMTRK